MSAETDWRALVAIEVADATRPLEAKIAALTSILRERERELLEAKGPCSTANCRLHRAHPGPCWIEEWAK